MTGDTAFAERPPEASFDFLATGWQVRSSVAAQRDELAPPYVPPPGQDHTKVVKA